MNYYHFTNQTNFYRTQGRPLFWQLISVPPFHVFFLSLISSVARAGAGSGMGGEVFLFLLHWCLHHLLSCQSSYSLFPSAVFLPKNIFSPEMVLSGEKLVKSLLSRINVQSRGPFLDNLFWFFMLLNMRWAQLYVSLISFYPPLPGWRLQNGSILGVGGHFQSQNLCYRFWTFKGAFWAWNRKRKLQHFFPKMRGGVKGRFGHAARP